MFKLTSLALVAAVASVAVSPAFAARGGPVTPPTGFYANSEGKVIATATPVVYTAQIDGSTQTLVLTGKNFGTNAPSVIMGSRALVVQEHSDSKIIAKFGQKPVAATYRLAVTNSSQNSHTGESFVSFVD